MLLQSVFAVVAVVAVVAVTVTMRLKRRPLYAKIPAVCSGWLGSSSKLATCLDYTVEIKAGVLGETEAGILTPIK
jgi:hypothetical protein